MELRMKKNTKVKLTVEEQSLFTTHLARRLFMQAKRERETSKQHSNNKNSKGSAK